MFPSEKLSLHNKNAIISVVDDDESVRKSLKRLLVAVGFDVRVFPCARDFLNEGPLYKHGCVIIDVHMPEMNGLALQKKLFDSGVSLPVIFITAYEDPRVRALAIEGGALTFLQKPFSEPSLLEAIDSALALSSKRLPGKSSAIGKDEKMLVKSALKTVNDRQDTEKGAESQNVVEKKVNDNFTATYWG